MSDGVIKVSVSANKRNSVNVSSSKNNTEVTATADAGRFWAQTAKNWAVSDVLVDNTDYSAKYYAQQSSISENNAKNHAETTQQIYNQFLDVVDTSTNNFLNTKEEALEDLENAKTETLATIQAKSVEGVESIENEANSSLEELISLKSSTLNEVNNTKIEATSSITTLSNDYISQINTTGKSYNTLTNKQITNCILETPQRIKYTLEDGTLTIKVGSIVIVPYGTKDLTADYPKGATFINDNFKVYDTQFEDGKFFVWVELVNDVSRNSFIANSTESIVSYNFSMDIVTVGAPGHWLSGATKPTTTAFFYNTTTNLIEYYDNGTLSQYTSFAFPLLIVSASSGIATSIKQVFNGMGYIGSTVWVDKGVKGLIPNGRNEDGTLRNIEVTTDKISLDTALASYSNNGTIALALNPVRIAFCDDVAYTYKENENLNFNSDWGISDFMTFGQCTLNAGKITNFGLQHPFRAVDWNEASRLGMPSDKWIDLTLGASGTAYVAPANGWFAVSKKAGLANAFIAIRNSVTAMIQIAHVPSSNNSCAAYMPSKKGDTVTVAYDATGATEFFRFIYTEGEV